jgi:hypothetical protein
MVASRVGAVLLILLMTGKVPADERWPDAPRFSLYEPHGPYQPAGGTTVVRATCRGRDTMLDIVQTRARVPQHDVDLGVTRLVLRDDSGRVLVEAGAAELWECQVYDPRTRRYVVTSVNEHGTKTTLRGLVYLDERRRTFVDSTLLTQSFEAVVATLSPGGHYFVFIGKNHPPDGGRKWRPGLYRLDLDTDRLRRLGKPPAPPPLPESMWKDLDIYYAWDAAERSFCELEKGILTFVDDHTVRISYGWDDHRPRATARHTRDFDLR